MTNVRLTAKGQKMVWLAEMKVFLPFKWNIVRKHNQVRRSLASPGTEQVRRSDMERPAVSGRPWASDASAGPARKSRVALAGLAQR